MNPKVSILTLKKGWALSRVFHFYSNRYLKQSRFLERDGHLWPTLCFTCLFQRTNYTNRDEHNSGCCSWYQYILQCFKDFLTPCTLLSLHDIFLFNFLIWIKTLLYYCFCSCSCLRNSMTCRRKPAFQISSFLISSELWILHWTSIRRKICLRLLKIFSMKIFPWWEG